MHTEFQRCLVRPLNAGYTVSVRRTRLNVLLIRLIVLVLLTLALAGESVADLYPSRGYTHPVTRAVEVSHAAKSLQI